MAVTPLASLWAATGAGTPCLKPPFPAAPTALGTVIPALTEPGGGGWWRGDPGALGSRSHKALHGAM